MHEAKPTPRPLQQWGTRNSAAAHSLEQLADTLRSMAAELRDVGLAAPTGLVIDEDVVQASDRALARAVGIVRNSLSTVLQAAYKVELADELKRLANAPGSRRMQ